MRPLLTIPDAFVSAVTKVEAPADHKLPQEDRVYFETLFKNINILPVSTAIIDPAVNLRHRRRMQFGDCLIAATAPLNGFTLYTRNTADFAHIAGLVIVNPIVG